MTDKNDDYYQPWLRDSASPPPSAPPGTPPGPDAGEGLAKPKDSPPVGIDLTRYVAEARPTRTGTSAAGQLKAGIVRGWQAIRAGGSAFAEWTIDVGARADIPARVEAMEIPRRSREAAQRSGVAAASTARTIGAGSARAGRATAAGSRALWQKMALGERMARLSSGAGRGLSEVADKTKAGIGQVAKAGKDSIDDAADKLRARGHEDASPPPSGLEQLLAREELEARTTRDVDAAVPDLPLFANDPVTAPSPTIEGDDRTPYAPAAKAKAPAHTGAQAMAAPPLPQRTTNMGLKTGMGMDALSRRGWLIGLAALALLALTFWAGGRLGGGMTKSDVETIVADYIKANPQIIPEALEAQRDGEIAKAIDAIRPALEKPYAGAWTGNANGDVTLVVFTDYACGFCRASVPDIDRLVREDKRVKVVFRELPIIAPQSRDAALMALAAARQGKYDAFHHAMFAAGSLDKSAIAAAAERSGVVTDGSADATANEALFQRELDSNLAIATQLQLNATPTWVVGDQLMQGQIGYDALRSAVAKARAKG